MNFLVNVRSLSTELGQIGNLGKIGKLGDIITDEASNNLVGIITLSILGGVVLLYVFYRIIKYWRRSRRIANNNNTAGVVRV